MNDRTYMMTVITILNNGTLIQRERTYGTGHFEWDRSMKSLGNELKGEGVKLENIAKVVVINGTDVFTYEGGEIAYILGL